MKYLLAGTALQQTSRFWGLFSQACRGDANYSEASLHETINSRGGSNGERLVVIGAGGGKT